jgi:hypothetical protein
MLRVFPLADPQRQSRIVETPIGSITKSLDRDPELTCAGLVERMAVSGVVPSRNAMPS